ncbi:hypothetical protein XENTR_v10018118 [Xenopus tropicalis]|nr:hypothetical protein XENTR_v10018118 [Xenopus tropicalis]
MQRERLTVRPMENPQRPQASQAPSQCLMQEVRNYNGIFTGPINGMSNTTRTDAHLGNTATKCVLEYGTIIS